VSTPPAGPPTRPGPVIAAARAAGAPSPARDACPRCGAGLEPAQGWCLRCGTAARTRLVPTPAWKVPVALVVAVVVVCLAALTWAFVALTSDQGPSGGGSATTAAPPAQTRPAQP
jgi:hypothetical protein